MSLHRCCSCGCDPGCFFVWSSSRIFPREKLLKKMKIRGKRAMRRFCDGEAVCFECRKELDKIE